MGTIVVTNKGRKQWTNVTSSFGNNKTNGWA